MRWIHCHGLYYHPPTLGFDQTKGKGFFKDLSLQRHLKQSTKGGIHNCLAEVGAVVKWRLQTSVSERLEPGCPSLCGVPSTHL